MVRPQSLDEAARNCRRRVGWSWTGSVAVDMAECRLDFETMHHGQRSGARPDHPITGSRIIHLVVRSEYKSGNAQELEQWAAVITRRAAAWAAQRMSGDAVSGLLEQSKRPARHAAGRLDSNTTKTILKSSDNDGGSLTMT